MYKKNFDSVSWVIWLIVLVGLFYMIWGLKMPYEIDKEFSQGQPQVVEDVRK